MKKIRHLFEYIILHIFFLLLGLLPINLVSLIGGILFQIFGPFTQSHKIAVSNYKKVFPTLNKKEIKINIMKSWDNLGKTFIELSILNKILIKKKGRINLLGLENIDKIKEKNEQVIFFSIHQANWELLVPTIDKLGIKVGAIYRHINNPYIDKFILNLRTKTLQTNKTFYTPKGKESAKNIINAINKGLSMILLIDQKDNAGNNIKLFDYYVKTQLGFLKIAYKYNLKLIPVQVIRKKINNFSIIFHPQLDLLLDNKNEINSMTKIHNIIEKWIKDHPNQWLWQHKRFG